MSFPQYVNTNGGKEQHFPLRRYIPVQVQYIPTIEKIVSNNMNDYIQKYNVTFIYIITQIRKRKRIEYVVKHIKADKTGECIYGGRTKGQNGKE